MNNLAAVLMLLVALLFSAVTATTVPAPPSTVGLERWKLKGKNIVVTGGSKGIGKSIVDELLSQGARVLTCSRNIEELRECAKEWKDRGFADVDIVACDVSTAEGREILTNECESLFGDSCIHCLVNNVGSNRRKLAVEYSHEEFDLIFRTNLLSAFFISTSLYPFLKASGGMICLLSTSSHFALML
jgi:Tropinone reductase 1